MLCRTPAVSLLIVLAWFTALPAAQVTAERSEKGVTVKIDGKLFTEYLVCSGSKPILWPILGPTGKPMTREYPMVKNGKKEAIDHIHHRSLWFTHGNVNGVDFWAEGTAKAGSIKHREFVKIESGAPAVIVVRNDWLDHDGKKVCEDERHLAFGADGAARWIDFDVTIKATEGPLAFGNTKEGSFGIRVADTLRVDSKKGGVIVNSDGLTNGAAWGKPASWVDYHGPVDGQTVGIAVLNHPGSFRYPTDWHVRTYGLFAANPFGHKSFLGKGEGGVSYTLPAGEKLTLGFRVLLHRGDEKEGKVSEAFAEYAKLKK
jgi:hypothetical protein